MRESIHFAHANSFPASVYKKMLKELAQYHDIGFIDTIGHNQQFPVTDCWPRLVDESIEFIQTHYSQPVFGVGHSLGGMLMFFAAIQRPDLFKGLVILDSPLMGPMRSKGIWLAKRLGFIDRLTPGGYTLKRRDTWPDTGSVRDYFSGKKLFSAFDPDCLADYAEFGTTENSSGARQLKFRPLIEHQIYQGLPHNHVRFRGKLTVPTTYIVGTQSSVLNAGDLNYLKRHFQMQVERQSGSHLFPLEHPVETGRHVLKVITEILERRPIDYAL